MCKSNKSLKKTQYLWLSEFREKLFRAHPGCRNDQLKYFELKKNTSKKNRIRIAHFFDVKRQRYGLTFTRDYVFEWNENFHRFIFISDVFS